MRSQSQSDRDLTGIEALKKREAEAADRLALPHEVKDIVTGVVKGAALAAAREDREPLDRIRHLESRLDEERQDKEDLQARLENVEGIRDELLAKVLDMAERGFNAKLALGNAVAADELEARKSKRDLIAKTVLYVLGMIAVIVDVWSRVK